MPNRVSKVAYRMQAAEGTGETLTALTESLWFPGKPKSQASRSGGYTLDMTNNLATRFASSLNAVNKDAEINADWLFRNGINLYHLFGTKSDGDGSGANTNPQITAAGDDPVTAATPLNLYTVYKEKTGGSTPNYMSYKDCRNSKITLRIDEAESMVMSIKTMLGQQDTTNVVGPRSGAGIPVVGGIAGTADEVDEDLKIATTTTKCDFNGEADIASDMRNWGITFDAKNMRIPTNTQYGAIGHGRPIISGSFMIRPTKAASFNVIEDAEDGTVGTLRFLFANNTGNTLATTLGNNDQVWGGSTTLGIAIQLENATVGAPFEDKLPTTDDLEESILTFAAAKAYIYLVDGIDYALWD